eukprot:NODE_6734_length_1643_cov_8.133245.p1 GENE.NODE_6734_length_1643_cov_8.133245~~NODE_6734_length_1643_cov_8.133245.p1  ORF type:complete len:337 (-),score=58.33 NODE_6734_length_1643_cov_8.133245:505-1515(-)
MGIRDRLQAPACSSEEQDLGKFAAPVTPATAEPCFVTTSGGGGDSLPSRMFFKGGTAEGSSGSQYNAWKNLMHVVSTRIKPLQSDEGSISVVPAAVSSLNIEELPVVSATALQWPPASGLAAAVRQPSAPVRLRPAPNGGQALASGGGADGEPLRPLPSGGGCDAESDDDGGACDDDDDDCDEPPAVNTAPRSSPCTGGLITSEYHAPEVDARMSSSSTDSGRQWPAGSGTSTEPEASWPSPSGERTHARTRSGDLGEPSAGGQGVEGQNPQAGVPLAKKPSSRTALAPGRLLPSADACAEPSRRQPGAGEAVAPCSAHTAANIDLQLKPKEPTVL